MEVLKNEELGSFIVRESTTRSGCFALSLLVPPEFQSSGIANYLILRTSRGFKIKVLNNGLPFYGGAESRFQLLKRNS